MGRGHVLAARGLRRQDLVCDALVSGRSKEETLKEGGRTRASVMATHKATRTEMVGILANLLCFLRRLSTLKVPEFSNFRSDQNCEHSPIYILHALPLSSLHPLYQRFPESLSRPPEREF